MIKLASLDLFRKVPRDLTQATRRGGVLSLSVASFISLVLFCEVVNYIRGDTKSRLVLDNNSDQLLDINFRLSFYELPCRFATIEAWDFLGNSRLDVTAKIEKTVLSAEHGKLHMQPYKELMPPKRSAWPALLPMLLNLTLLRMDVF
ncbi:Protein disulfide-isomerase 5-3 [Gracilariopsis chorda]|uniref:Protein disulfide-isomerase 5-3 n=1 Tax=Gracilariopsis chorda TaxID=448386 RepID=A0A2V3J0Z3_9FLOR|nr:Protein disulfide-isomerase 5-3 [Gracilariopsis chorda]|eukprot:PXF47973.1 Protein disulfide-isomerase 5-3 [Gracilariopsis chorda]